MPQIAGNKPPPAAQSEANRPQSREGMPVQAANGSIEDCNSLKSSKNRAGARRRRQSGERCMWRNYSYDDSDFEGKRKQLAELLEVESATCSEAPSLRGKLHHASSWYYIRSVCVGGDILAQCSAK